MKRQKSRLPRRSLRNRKQKVESLKLKTVDSTVQIRIVAGLGNPGKKYADTRHNAGFWVIDSLAEALKIELKKKKFGGRFGETLFAGKNLILLEPQLFMNRSGQVVAAAVGFYGAELGDLLVVADDMALEPGRIRIRAKGSAGGHNGLADIIEKLGTTGFARLRVGIGQAEHMAEDRMEFTAINPSRFMDAYDYVLSKPMDAQKPLLDEAVEKARDAVFCWLECGIEAAMNKFNKKV